MFIFVDFKQDFKPWVMCLFKLFDMWTWKDQANLVMEYLFVTGCADNLWS